MNLDILAISAHAMLGRQIGVEYAEAFTMARPPGVRDLFDVI